MKLIVGLGNPGPDYTNHRHNIGQWVLDALAKKLKLKWEKASRLAVETWGDLEGEDCWLAKPLTYMNVSGRAIKVLLKDKKVDPQDLIVVHDDMDIRLGKMRWVFDSGYGGHNGAKSIIESIGTQAFYRIRLGVGRPQGRKDPADYVLEPFEGDDLVVAEELTVRAVDSIKDFIKHNLQWVQNRYH